MRFDAVRQRSGGSLEGPQQGARRWWRLPRRRPWWSWRATSSTSTRSWCPRRLSSDYTARFIFESLQTCRNNSDPR